MGYFAFTRGIGWPDLTAIRCTVPSLSTRGRIRVGSPDLGSSSMTFDAAIGAVSSMMPLSWFGVAARFGFFTMFTPSTCTRNSLGQTRSPLPSLPRCSPEITRTVSRLAMCILWRSGSRASARVRLFLFTSGFMSDHLGRERDDLHEPLVAQLAPHRPEDAGGAGLALVGDEHGGVLVEPDVRAVLAVCLLCRADDHRLHHLAFLDLAGGDGVLDRHHDDVPQPRVAALGPAEHPDHERAPRARVVCDLENRLLLHHGSPLLVPATSRARRSRPPATAWSSTAVASRRSAPCRPPWRPARRAPRVAVLAGGGGLAAARAGAARARCSAPPSSSSICRPGFPAAPQPWG